LFCQSSKTKSSKGEDDEEFNSDMEDSDDDEETVEKEEEMEAEVDHKAEIQELEAEGKVLERLLI
jgi:hypothetical protein